MKGFLVRIVLFFVIILAVDFCFGKAFDYMNAHAKGGSTKQMYDLCMTDQYDVIILGSSRAHHHYVSSILEDSLGMSCYNAGVDGNGIILMTGIYRMIIDRYQPKLIIYDVEQAFDLFEYKNDDNCIRYLSPQKPFYNHPGVERIFKDISPEEYYKTLSGLYRYNSVSIPLMVDFVYDRPMDLQGYSPMYGCMKEEPIAKEESEQSVIDDKKLEYMEQFIKDVAEKHIPLMVVASPKYGSKNTDVFQPIIDLCTAYNVPFIDFYSNQEFMECKRWFKEPMHLNDEGAKVFTSRLAGEIKDHYNR